MSLVVTTITGNGWPSNTVVWHESMHDTIKTTGPAVKTKVPELTAFVSWYFASFHVKIAMRSIIWLWRMKVNWYLTCFLTDQFSSRNCCQIGTREVETTSSRWPGSWTERRFEQRASHNELHSGYRKSQPVSIATVFDCFLLSLASTVFC